jgi:nicotinamide riboside transporter PnuC
MLSATVFEWTGTAMGILGSVMVSSKTRFSPYGWIAFLVSSLSLARFGFMTGAYGLLTLEIVFVCTNVLGLWRWLLSPYIESTKAKKMKG